MSRRLDLHPNKRLRNPDRHLRALRRWSETIVQHLPQPAVLERWDDKFWRVLLPINSKLVSPRHTNPEIRRAVVQCLLDAAARLRQELVLVRPVRIACLVTVENLWRSELTLFFSDDYFATFVPKNIPAVTETGGFRVSTLPPVLDLVRDWQLDLPEGLEDRGGYRMIEEELGEPDATLDQHHWVFAEPRYERHPVSAIASDRPAP